MEEASGKAYGEGRVRASVSYGEVERAAITLLKSERRPTVENLREALGHGSPETIGNALKRFWRDLGIRIEGDPAALTRMPPDIADLADGMWQRALKLAGDAAETDGNAARERLTQIQIENEVRALSFALREREYDAAARAREKALADSSEHLLLLLRRTGLDQEALRAREVRINDLETQVTQYRLQLASMIERTASRHRVRKPTSDKYAKSAAPRRVSHARLSPEKRKPSKRSSITRRKPKILRKLRPKRR